MQTYHKNIENGIPSNIMLPHGMMKIHPSKHSIHRALEKGFKIPSQINVLRENIIEAYINTSKDIEKLLIRLPYDTTKDICMVVKPSNGFLITSWLNAKDDNHTTLNVSRYN